jgi:hypothetical protein
MVSLDELTLGAIDVRKPTPAQILAAEKYRLDPKLVKGHIHWQPIDGFDGTRKIVERSRE